MAPIVHGLEAKYYGKIKFVFLDADDLATKKFQSELGFYYQPEFYLLDGNGNVLRKFVGYVEPQDFEAEFAKHLP